MRSVEVFISRLFFICFSAVNFGLSNAQISSATANFSDTLEYPVYGVDDPYFIFHTSTPGIPVQGSLLATPPYGTPGFDFSWSKYNPSGNNFDPPFHSESGVATSRVDNLDPGCYQVHITATDLDTNLRAWVFSNDSYVAVEKDVNGKIKPYKYTCDYLWLNGVAEAEIHTYYDLANGNPVNLPNGMTFKWTADDAEYEILGAERFLDLIIYNGPPYSRPPTKDTRFTLTAVDSFGLSRADDVLYESVHVKAEFTTYIEDKENPGNWIEEPNPSGEAPLEVRFINLSENGVEYEWTLVDSSKTGEESSEVITESLEDSVVYTYYIPDHYFPAMTAYSEAGCVDSFPLVSRVDIVVEPSELDAPNVFTPNGDGVNDYFLVQAKSLKSFKITIFSRSGHKVYEFEQTEEKFEWEGWDGTIQGKGENFAQPGVYYYVIEAVGWDAERYRGHPPYKGFVYLYRESE
jgi:gliding motility-associated-like protein